MVFNVSFTQKHVEHLHVEHLLWHWAGDSTVSENRLSHSLYETYSFNGGGRHKSNNHTDKRKIVIGATL